MADLRRGGLDGRGGRLEIRYGQKIQVTGIAHPIPSWCHSTLEKCGGASNQYLSKLPSFFDHHALKADAADVLFFADKRNLPVF